MLWRRFNGDAIELPIKKAVEKAIQKETEAGNRVKSLHRHRQPGKKPRY